MASDMGTLQAHLSSFFDEIEKHFIKSILRKHYCSIRNMIMEWSVKRVPDGCRPLAESLQISSHAQPINDGEIPKVANISRNKREVRSAETSSRHTSTVCLIEGLSPLRAFNQRIASNAVTAPRSLVGTCKM